MNERARGCVASVLLVFAGLLGLSASVARIEVEELCGVLVFDCIIGLALAVSVVLGGDPRLERRKRWMRLGVAIAMGILASTFLVSLHVFQIEARKGARQRIEQLERAREKAIPPASPADRIGRDDESETSASRD